jgi:predicted ATPase
VGRVDEGLCLLEEALTTAHSTGERNYEAEVYRLQGELRLGSSAVRHGETCLHQALETARRQGAKALELRAAVSLCRLWQRQGKRDDARELLAPAYAWFNEGFDTADLREAKALLDALSSP